MKTIVIVFVQLIFLVSYAHAQNWQDFIKDTSVLNIPEGTDMEDLIDLEKLMELQKNMQNQNQKVETANFENYNNKQICSFQMKIESKGKNSTKKEGMINKLTFDATKTAMEMQTNQNESITSIMDFKENTLTSVMKKDGKVTQAFKMKMSRPVISNEEENSEMKITVTDERKDIGEHKNCRKIIVESKDDYSEIWVDETIKLDYMSLTAGMNAGKNKNDKENKMDSYMKNYNIKGFPIEVYSKDLKSGNENSIYYSNIVINNIDRKVFDLSGVDIMDMTQMPGY